MCSRTQRTSYALCDFLAKHGFNVNDPSTSVETIHKATKEAMKSMTGYTLSSRVTFLSRLRKEMTKTGFSQEQVLATRMPLQTKEKNEQDVETRTKKNADAYEIPEWLDIAYVKGTLQNVPFNGADRWFPMDVACLQIALCARVTELLTMELVWDESPGVAALEVKGCLKGDKNRLHRVVSCVSPKVLYNAWRHWNDLSLSMKMSLVRQRNYNDWLKSRVGITSHRLRSIGGQFAVQRADPPTLAKKASMLSSALRHSSVAVTLHSYADIGTQKDNQ